MTRTWPSTSPSCRTCSPLATSRLCPSRPRALLLPPPRCAFPAPALRARPRPAGGRSVHPPRAVPPRFSRQNGCRRPALRQHRRPGSLARPPPLRGVAWLPPHGLPPRRGAVPGAPAADARAGSAPCLRAGPVPGRRYLAGACQTWCARLARPGRSPRSPGHLATRARLVPWPVLRPKPGSPVAQANPAPWPVLPAGRHPGTGAGLGAAPSTAHRLISHLGPCGVSSMNTPAASSWSLIASAAS